MNRPQEVDSGIADLMEREQVPLVVDLDGTLSRTDTLHEALLEIAGSAPAKLFGLAAALPKGRSVFKARVADHVVMAPDRLILDPDVRNTIEAARIEGRRTLLVSAADQRQVDAVATATGLFDEAIGSDESRNLKGDEKAAYLVDRFGVGGFDYIGDSQADIPVWRSARTAFVARPTKTMLRRAEAANARTQAIGTAPETGRSLLKAMRPHQWTKNLLLFLPMAAAHDFSAIGQVLAAFVAFCMMASSVYIVNDLVDLAADRAHPRKRKRPFAAGDLSLSTGIAMAAVLIFGASAIAALTGNLPLLGVLWCYFAATLTYSFWLKRKPVIDVILLAGLYTIRIVAGGVAAEITLSPWMLGFSMFLFLALAAVKRQAELVDSIRSDRDVVGRGYTAGDLPIIQGVALTASQSAVVVLALYISSSDVQMLYAQPQLIWAICPLLMYWLIRMVMKAHRGEMDDDPIVFAATDKISLAIVAVSMAIVFAASA